MVAGIVIEDNTLQVATLDEMNVPKVNLIMGNQFFHGRLLINQNHVYTDSIIDKLRLASPDLSLFDHLLAPNHTGLWEKSNTWSHQQLLAILFKKVLFSINTQDIGKIDQIRLVCPMQFGVKDYQQIEEAFLLNQIYRIQRIDRFQAIQNYILNHDPELLKKALILVDLSEHSVNIKSNEKETIKPISEIKRIIHNQVLLKNPKKVWSDETSPISDIILELDIDIIYKDYLNQQMRSSYPLQFQSQLVEFVPDEDKIDQMIISLLREVLEPVLKQDSAIYFTGQLIRSTKIRSILGDEILPNLDIQFDQENTAKLKGLFTGISEIQNSLSPVDEQKYGFLQEIIIDNELF